MRPLAVLIAIIFGSSAAITFGLLATLVVLAVLKGKYPQFAAELLPLLQSSALFIAVLGASGGALYATLTGRSWHWIAQTGMWFTLACVGLVYWPSG